MIFVQGLIVGFLLGAVAFGVLAILMLAHRRPAPTFHHRRFRDAPVEVVPKWEREEVGGIDYKFMGVANEEV